MTCAFLSVTTVAAAERSQLPSQCGNSGPIAIDQKLSAGFEHLTSVQGIAVAVYTPQGTYADGFGVTDVNTQEAVSSDTAFYIASSTKSMLALALASMDARGEIDLDQPIAEFAPEAPFSRSIQTDRITLRDLLAMSSGIKNPAYIHRVAYSGEHTQGQLWDLIAATERNRSRSIQYGKFRYTNWNYNLAARLVEERHEIRWQDLLADEIFDKLGMTRTTAYMSRATDQGWSVARPHSTFEQDGAIRTYLEKTDATMHSAGGVIMSANDALKWLEIFVEDGQLDGEQIFAASTIQSTRQRLTEANTEFNGYKREHYGLGWYIGPYRETQNELVHHFGGFSGARAHVSYMPEQKIGVAVFANDAAVGGRFIDAIANYIYDCQIGMEDAEANYLRDINEIDLWATDIRERLGSLRMEIAAREWSLSEPLAAYSGVYAHEDFGTVSVAVENDQLRVTNGNMTALAQAGSEPETVRVELRPLEGEAIGFQVDGRGSVRRLEYEGVRFDRQH